MYKNVGTMDLGVIAPKVSTPVMDARNVSLTDSAVASGQAFLVSELEKRDMLVRTPLSSMTYPRDIPIRVGGGWAEYVSAMGVEYGVAGGSGANLAHSGGANGIPMVQANFSKEQFRTHMVALGTRVMWIDVQRGSMTGRNMDSLLRDGVRMSYDKHMELNTYKGIKEYGTTGLLNNPNVTIVPAAGNIMSLTPDQILALFNNIIVLAQAAAEYDRDAIINHILLPYEQFNYLATTKVTELAEKTILTFLMENNVAKLNGVDLFIGATAWNKGAGEGGTDRMVAYCNNERFLAMDELVPLTRAMTGQTTNHFCYDTAYAGNVSEVQVFYDQPIIYVDGI